MSEAISGAGVRWVLDVASLSRATKLSRKMQAPLSPLHCERSEAIHCTVSGEMDCFAALAMTAGIVSCRRDRLVANRCVKLRLLAGQISSQLVAEIVARMSASDMQVSS